MAASTEEESLVLDFDLQIDDLVAGTMIALERTPAHRRLRRMLLIGGTGLVAATGLVLGAGYFGAGTTALFAAGMILYDRLFLPRIQEEQARSVYLEGRTRYALGPQRIELRADALLVSNALSSTMWRWLAVERVEQTRSHVYIGLAGGRSAVIPRRAFRSDDDYLRFIERLRRHHAAVLPPGAKPPALGPG